MSFIKKSWLTSFKPTPMILLLGLSLPVKANEYIDNMMKIISPAQSQIAVNIWDVSNGKTVYRINDQTLMLPASIQKVITAVAASNQLGKTFQYETSLTYDGAINDGTLNGNLYLHFQGDPTLKRAHLTTLINQLTELKISQISGDVTLIAHASNQTRAPGWAWDDLGICYAAPVSNFIIDRNCAKATLSPTEERSTVKVKSIYPINIKTTAEFDPTIPVKDAQMHFCELHMQRFDGNHYKIEGCYPGKKPIRLAIAVNDPKLYSQQVISDLLTQKGIQFTEVKTAENAPTTQTVIATHYSKPLPDLLKIMLQKSDNLIADSLLKQIGLSYFHQKKHKVNHHDDITQSARSDSFTLGARAIESIMLEIGLPFIEANITDGSGLSRYNLLTAQQMMSLLQFIKQDKDTQYIEQLLPVSGRSGTLKHKAYYNQPPLKNVVQAKTGTMMGVENLAGYITASNGKQYAFVIIENGLSAKAKKARLAPFSALFLQTLNDLPN